MTPINTTPEQGGRGHMADNEHALFDFIQSATEELAREYRRIQRRTLQDPGTAGDEGEENWAALLREWLPPAYRVVTKGRILSQEGTAGPQLDVLILHPNYPPFLVNKKLYLASGVLAAFECKLTLKAEHITKATQNSATVKRLCVARQGSPYHELFSPLKYGLLAHAHVWNKPRSTPFEHVSTGLDEADDDEVKHPRESLDLGSGVEILYRGLVLNDETPFGQGFGTDQSCGNRAKRTLG
jgi:hypothetical protein